MDTRDPFGGEEPDTVARRIIQRLRDDPAQQRMWAAIAERTARSKAKFAGIDVVDLGERDWQEWLSVNHLFDRWKAKGRRQRHRHARKMADRSAGRPWGPNDPRVSLCLR